MTICPPAGTAFVAVNSMTCEEVALGPESVIVSRTNVSDAAAAKEGVAHTNNAQARIVIRVTLYSITHECRAPFSVGEDPPQTETR